MPKKRKNGGKNRHNRGNKSYVRCDVSGRAVPKDKAIKRFVVRNLVDASGAKDLSLASVYDSYTIPKMYYKTYYCVSAAIHQRIGLDERKNREPPRQVLKRWEQQRQKEREIEKKKLENKQKRIEAIKAKQKAKQAAPQDE
ncbi:hypothetical protein RFI_14486 [Reticulomyxa filosa]|uniref:40S ribosomal protein S26 n=1 Tax=Reticulomyxa filosa TaxID=46433 RepID=X6NBK6_RETFI|nr:hypothetical protein RFI_14486 [Reticulomyxa filosa]|eukprot:ETO22707.1 hypothetical protein RFI_14486 [Reticulomyxa filosa]